MVQILALIIVLAIAIPIGILKAFVLSVLWGWFIVPFGIVDIGIVHAWGIILVGSIFNGIAKDEIKITSKLVSQSIAQPIAVLAIGYILHII